MARLFGLGMLARTPEAGLGLLFILRTRELGGSYALAGVVSAAIGLSLAFGGPVLGRLIDRRGQTPVLLVTAVVAGLALLGAAILPPGSAPAALIPLASVVGLSAPPIAPCLRSLFARLLDRDLRERAFALDAALQEVSFTAGPLIFVTAIGSLSVPAAMAAAGICLFLGTCIFALSPQARSVGPDLRRRSRWGALESAGIRTLLCMAIGVGGMYGATEVGLTARVGELHGGPVLLGLLIVVWSAPSLVAGLVVARVGMTTNLVRALVLLSAAVGLLTILLGATSGLLATGLMLGLSGMIAAPLFSVIYSLVANLATAGSLTEANTWVGSGLFGGLALGSAVGGALINLDGAGAAFLAGGGLALLAAIVAALRSAGLAADVPVHARGDADRAADAPVVAEPSRERAEHALTLV